MKFKVVKQGLICLDGFTQQQVAEAGYMRRFIPTAKPAHLLLQFVALGYSVAIDSHPG